MEKNLKIFASSVEIKHENLSTEKNNRKEIIHVLASSTEGCHKQHNWSICHVQSLRLLDGAEVQKFAVVLLADVTFRRGMFSYMCTFIFSVNVVATRDFRKWTGLLDRFNKKM